MRLVGEIGTDLIFNRREQQTFTAVHDCLFQFFGNDRGSAVHISFVCFLFQMLIVIGEGDGDNLFLLRTVNCHDTVVGDLGNLLTAVIVHLIDMLFVDRILLQLGDKNTGLHDGVLKRPAQLGIIGNILRDDVLGALNRICGCLDLFAQILLSFRIEVTLCRKSQHPVSQRLQAVLDCDRGTCLFLLLVRLVQVFHFRELLAGEDGITDFIGQLALLFDQVQNRFLAFLQVDFIFMLFLNEQNLFFIESLRLVLAVPCNKRNRRSFFKKAECNLDLRLGNLQFFCD